MRLQHAENQPDVAEQKEFADWLLEVGEGRIPTIRGLENNIIRLPNDIIRDGSVLEKTGPGPVLRSVFTVFGP